MSKKSFTLNNDGYNIHILHIKLIDKIVKYLPTGQFKNYIKPEFFDRILYTDFQQILVNDVYKSLITTRNKIKDYALGKIIQEYLYKDNLDQCSIAIGPCHQRKSQCFKLIHINENIQKNKKSKQYRQLFISHNQLKDNNLKITSLYDLIGHNKWYPENKPEIVYILVFDHPNRIDLQSNNELNKQFILKYLEFYPIEGLGQLEDTTNLFKKKQKIEKEIGDYFGERGLNYNDIMSILIQIPQKSLIHAVNYYMEQRLMEKRFNGPEYKDIYIE